MGLFRRRKARSHPEYRRDKQPEPWAKQAWSKPLEDNLNMLRDAFGESETLIHRLSINGRDAATVFLEGMIDRRALATEVLKPLSDWQSSHPGRQPSLPELTAEVWAASALLEVEDIGAAADSMAAGTALFLLDGNATVLAVFVEGYPKRHPSEPKYEPVLRGAKESYVETLTDNLAMLRRTLPDHRLRLDARRVGTRTRTRVVVAYIQDIADPDLVREALKRIDGIKTDAILESHSLEEWIQDYPWSPFPMMLDTERPDTTAAALLEGRVAILMDRCPHALILPVTFFDFFKNAADYAQPYYHATFVRWIRVLSFLFSFTLPALYIALLGFSPEVIPPKLVLSIMGTRQGIPFPAVFEVLVLDVMMEVLREATVRMPSHMGQTIGVVGGIVLGTAVVQAGIVSNIMLIIVALAAVASFAAGNYTFSRGVRLLKYFLILPAATLGLYGYIGGMSLILLYLCSLESFGVPFLTPLSPLHPRDLKDLLVRSPQFVLTNRSTSFHPSDSGKGGNPSRP